MAAFAVARELRRVITVSCLGVLISAASCGGESGCALAPGPCAGTFPAENILQPTVEPAEITVVVGGTATFTVDPNSLMAPRYEWYRAGPGTTLVRVPGASGVSYSVVNAQRSDDGATFSVLIDAARGNGRIVLFSTDAKLHVTTVP